MNPCAKRSGTAASVGLGSFQLGGFLFDKIDNVINHFVVAKRMGLFSGKINHTLTRPAAGKADVCHQRLSGAIDHAANDRQA